MKDPGVAIGDVSDFLLHRFERWVPLFIFLFAASTRYYRLDKPSGVVFDEHHFGRFTNQYTAGTYFFDIHPPLGKLVFYAVGRAIGYNHTVCDYESIDRPYKAECEYIWLRATSAFFGSATAPLVYHAARGLGAGVWGGVLAAGLFVMDGLNAGESRLILIDAQLIFWCTASLVVAQMWWLRWGAHWDAAAEATARVEALYSVTEEEAAAVGGGGSASLKGAADAEGDADKDGAGADEEPPEPPTAKEGPGRGGKGGGGKKGPKAATSASPASSPAGGKGPRGDAARSPPSKPPQQRLSAAAAVRRATPSEAALAAARAGLYADARFMPLYVRLLWAGAVGVVCANAISIKFTGLATPGIVGVESFFGLFLLRRGIPFGDLLAVLVAAFCAYSAYWYAHFALLPLTGDGDIFMPHDFKRTLIGNEAYDPNTPGPGFWTTMGLLNYDMVKSSDSIKERHNWDSVWHEWLINGRGVLYYSVGKSHTYTEAVYLLGNPLVVWGILGFIAAAVLLLLLFLRFRAEPASSAFAFAPKLRALFPALAFCLTVYALNLLPYMLVHRSCFIYHYMPALMYGHLAAALVIERASPRASRPFVAKMTLLIAGACYLFYSPWIYAFPLTSEGHQRRRWLQRWD